MSCLQRDEKTGISVYFRKFEDLGLATNCKSTEIWETLGVSGLGRAQISEGLE